MVTLPTPSRQVTKASPPDSWVLISSPLSLIHISGIKTIYVASEEMNHGWNAVRLDGQTYFIDCTFDDPVPDRGQYVSDQFFMLTAEELSKTHVWDEAFYEQVLDNMEKENS